MNHPLVLRAENKINCIFSITFKRLNKGFHVFSANLTAFNISFLLQMFVHTYVTALH